MAGKYVAGIADEEISRVIGNSKILGRLSKNEERRRKRRDMGVFRINDAAKVAATRFGIHLNC